ncbi:hypothetical protein EBT31_11460 [bacterium]|nr:hypothetical protein [bacterium]
MILVFKVVQEHKVQLVHREPQVLMDLKVPPEPQVLKVLLELRVQLEIQEAKELQVPRARREPLVLKVLQV